MNDELKNFISSARLKKISDEEIRARLKLAQWRTDVIENCFADLDDLKVPTPPPDSRAGQSPIGESTKSSNGPIAVVQTRSTNGLEYTIMFIALWISAICLGGLLHNIVSNFSGENIMGGDVYSAGLIVCLPIFLILFFRLKHKELKDPSITADTSRKRAIQLTLVVTFLAAIFHFIFYVYGLVNGDQNPGQSFMHLLVTLFVAGPIFVYYWHDEHAKRDS